MPEVVPVRLPTIKAKTIASNTPQGDLFFFLVIRFLSLLGVTVKEFLDIHNFENNTSYLGERVGFSLSHLDFFLASFF